MNLCFLKASYNVLFTICIVDQIFTAVSFVISLIASYHQACNYLKDN